MKATKLIKLQLDRWQWQANILKFPKIPAKLCLNGCLWTQFGRFFFSTFQNSRKKRFLAAILANIGLTISQADLGLDAAQFSVLHTLRSKNSTTASWTLNLASSIGAPSPPLSIERSLYGRWFVAGADQATVENTFGGWCVENWDKNSIVSQQAKNGILRGCDGRSQDNTSNLSHPRAWVEINSSGLSPTLMSPFPEQRGVTIGCLYLEIEGHLCLVGIVWRLDEK